MFELDLTSKASVLWPRAPVSPAELSIVISTSERPTELSIENTWTRVLRMFRAVILEVPVKL